MAFFFFGKNAIGEHLLFHNRHIRMMQDVPVEPAAPRSSGAQRPL